MYVMPPVTMQVQVAQPCCIVDVPLALSCYGLTCATLLSRVTRVWLSPTLWAIVDDPGFYLAQGRLVGRLAGLADGTATDKARAGVRTVIEHWRRARDEYGLDVREGIFWPAEKLGEAVVPKGSDGHLLDRIDALAVGLERRRQPAAAGSPGDVDVLADCARDTLALAAALVDERPIVLTTRPAEAAPPDISGYVSASGIPCRRLEDLAVMRLLRGSLAPLLVHAGLVDLVAAGSLRLAAVSLIAPSAALPPRRMRIIDDDGVDLAWNDEGLNEAALWDQAAVIWYDLP